MNCYKWFHSVNFVLPISEIVIITQLHIVPGAILTKLLLVQVDLFQPSTSDKQVGWEAAIMCTQMNGNVNNVHLTILETKMLF